MFYKKLFAVFSPLFLILAIACGGESTTEPKVDELEVSVHYEALAGCATTSTAAGSLNMGTVVFENTTNTHQLVPKQLAVKLNSTSNAGVMMWMFGPEWRNADGSITANIDAQTDPVASYIQFGTLPAIPPGGKFATTLKGSVPSMTAGTYVFAIIGDSMKVSSSAGDSAFVKLGAQSFTLTLKATCP
jgi:hypothetical protein